MIGASVTATRRATGLETLVGGIQAGLQGGKLGGSTGNTVSGVQRDARRKGLREQDVGELHLLRLLVEMGAQAERREIRLGLRDPSRNMLREEQGGATQVILFRSQDRRSVETDGAIGAARIDTRRLRCEDKGPAHHAQTRWFVQERFAGPHSAHSEGFARSIAPSISLELAKIPSVQPCMAILCGFFRAMPN